MIRWNVLWLFLLTPLTAHASDIRLGIQGGVNLANASVEPAASPELTSRTGIVGGGFFEVDAGSSLYAVGEANYVQKGAKQGTTTFKYDYLSFVALLKLQPSLPVIKPFAFVGAGIDTRMTAQTQTAAGQVEDPNISSLDFTGQLGAGVELEMTFWPFNFFVSGRYSLGLLDVDSRTSQVWKNKGLQLLAGFIIRTI